MKIEILNGHLVDPANKIDQTTNLFIADGKVAAVGHRPPGFKAKKTIDASNHLVIPGIVDIGMRLGEPGIDHTEQINCESKAAVSAGITTLCCFPDTGPIIDTPAEIDSIQRHQRQAGQAHIHVIAALTKELAGTELSEMASLKAAGCLGVSNTWQPLDSSRVARRALEYAASHDLTVYIHPEDHGLLDNGCAHEGAVATRLGLPGIPEAAETAAIGFYLPLIEATGARVHFCRLSTRQGIKMIRRARHDGLPITADVNAHQLFLTEMDLADFNPLFHTRPPLRTMRDRDGLREALSNGSLQAICSDHLPLSPDAKLAPFPATLPGISALETLLALTLRLVEEKVIELTDAIRLLTAGPAEILDIKAGQLGTDDRADISIIDPEASWECDPYQFQSEGKNSPFGGWHFKGRVTKTLVAGKTVFVRR
ncbi:MAG TPA: dihydroorotase [Chromatiales bacterium]|nr:dihydroorotase [Thiotrichales bacterium]HIP69109.1 dihydroorotase [Chromatiales bacterium]